MLNIIFSKPYNEVREQCHLLKTGETKGIEDYLQEIENSLPVKAVLVPMPQSSGRAEYTLSLASRIALYVNALHNDKTVIVLNCLNGKIRDSVCGRKTIGLPFDDIEFGFAYMDGMKARVAKFREEGWKISYGERFEPTREGDSGWFFSAGNESSEYINNPKNLELWLINSVTMYDSALSNFITAPYGTAIVRTGHDKFEIDAPGKKMLVEKK